MFNLKNRRRNYFIKKKFQTDFFFKFSLLIFLEAILIYVLFVYIAKGTLTAAYRGSEFTIERTSHFFMNDFMVVAIIGGAVVGILAAVVLMYLSHRIGGALYRFEKTLEDAGLGNFTQRVTLRKNDELVDLKTKFNLFLETMDGRISNIKDEVSKGVSALSDDKGSPDANALRESLHNIKDLLEYFKTTK